MFGERAGFRKFAKIPTIERGRADIDESFDERLLTLGQDDIARWRVTPPNGANNNPVWHNMPR
jgi:hypothetical protein